MTFVNNISISLVFGNEFKQFLSLRLKSCITKYELQNVVGSLSFLLVSQPYYVILLHKPPNYHTR